MLFFFSTGFPTCFNCIISLLQVVILVLSFPTFTTSFAFWQLRSINGISFPFHVFRTSCPTSTVSEVTVFQQACVRGCFRQCQCSVLMCAGKNERTIWTAMRKGNLGSFPIATTVSHGRERVSWVQRHCSPHFHGLRWHCFRYRKWVCSSTNTLFKSHYFLCFAFFLRHVDRQEPVCLPIRDNALIITSAFSAACPEAAVR